jgi:hypothetical protein
VAGNNKKTLPVKKYPYSVTYLCIISFAYIHKNMISLRLKNSVYKMISLREKLIQTFKIKLMIMNLSKHCNKILIPNITCPVTYPT